MGWKPNDQAQIIADAAEDVVTGHLTFRSAPETEIAFETKNTCGMTWKVSLVELVNGDGTYSPIRNWFSTATKAGSSSNQRVTGRLTFDFASFNLSSATNTDRLRVEDAWKNQKQLKTRISFIDKGDLSYVYLTLAKPP